MTVAAVRPAVADDRPAAERFLAPHQLPHGPRTLLLEALGIVVAGSAIGDPPATVALVADDADGGLLGVGALQRLYGPWAEAAVVVDDDADAEQALLDALNAAARQQGVTTVTATIRRNPH